MTVAKSKEEWNNFNSNGLTSMKYFSGDGITQILGEYDNFIVDYKVTLDFSN